MSEQIHVSGPIVFQSEGLRPENYFIESNNSLTGLDTHKLEPKDLRELADHLEALRASR